jgi:hypothetical protein
MPRLLVAIALVLHLSGLSAVAAVVCNRPGMTATSCCCHHGNAPGNGPSASPKCPCTMAPQPTAPAAPMPATERAPTHNVAAFQVAVPAVACVLPVRHLLLHIPAVDDSSPPYLTAAHPRC